MERREAPLLCYLPARLRCDVGAAEPREELATLGASRELSPASLDVNKTRLFVCLFVEISLV